MPSLAPCGQPLRNFTGIDDSRLTLAQLHGHSKLTNASDPYVRSEFGATLAIVATVRSDLEGRTCASCAVASASIVHRTAGGDEVSVVADRVRLAALLLAAPWRTFRWYERQRHYSGQYWSATERSLVIYESRMELAALLLADFDTAVERIVAQPFCMAVVISGKPYRHIPDFLLSTDGGPIVVDVIRSERLAHTGVQFVCSWTQQVLESIG
jgi:hypothetical protein